MKTEVHLKDEGRRSNRADNWSRKWLGRALALELANRVIALNPGVINADMLASCFGASASLYQPPQAWALKAATMILNLTPAHNGASLTVST
ncbi:NADPH-dependent pterin aldehyde reductase [Glycine soja]